MKERGIFLTFEGPDGAGKSTLIRRMSSTLRKKGYRVVVTREPGGSAVSEKIRKLILNSKMNAWTELFLYEAARSEHVSNVIQPALKEGKIILCDRYTDSSLAYQAFTRGLPWRRVQILNDLATRGTKPDLTLLLDIDPKISLMRAKAKNRFEAEGIAFQQKVRRGFFKAKSQSPRRWLVLNAAKESPEELEAQVFLVLEKRGWIRFRKERMPLLGKKKSSARTKRK